MELPVHIPVGTAGCFGMLYQPAATPAGAILICDPLFEERKAAQRPLVEAARTLCGAGWSVLRFDYRGCGDSPGNFEDFTVDDWIADTTAALNLLRQRFPEAPLGLLAVRFGAVPALYAAATAEKLKFVVLWEPAANGPEYLRQELRKKLMKEMVTFGGSRQTRDELVAELQAGGMVDCDGYALTSRLFASLATRAEPPPRLPAGLALRMISITPGGDIPAPAAKLATALTAAGARLQHDGFKFPPFWNLIGHTDCGDLAAVTRDWLSALAAPVNLTCNNLPADSGIVSAAPGDRYLEFTAAGETIRAILSAPPAGAASRQTGIVFLHGWSGGRLGPHRMFLKLARHFTGNGITCLRPDFRGRGDSDGVTAKAGIPTMIADARAAVDTLVRETGVTTVYLLGICSGGKVAVGAAADDPRVNGLILWSAEAPGRLRDVATNRRKTWFALKTYVRKLVSPQTWKKIVTGKVNVKQVNKAVFEHETRSAAEAVEENRFLDRFRQSFRHPILFIYGGNDPETRLAAENYRRFCEKNRIPATFHEIAEANHSFYSLGWERQVLELTETWVQARHQEPARMAN